MKTKLHNKLEILFFEHYEEWCLLSYAYLKNRTESEEVVQDVCVKLLLRESDYEILNLKAYISTAVKNNSIQSARKLKKFIPLSESQPLVSAPYEDTVIALEHESIIHNAIDTLPELSKNVFNLCVLEGEKYQQVADTLGISVNTVKYHMKKTFKMLRTRLQNTYFFTLYMLLSLFF